MNPRTVVLTGATGFIGSAVLEALRGSGEGVCVRVVGRTPVPESPGAVESVVADLTDPASLRGVCEGTEALVHAASYVGGDIGLCRAVNEEGGAAIAREARACGLGRIIQVSTAAVYGRGPHRGIGVDEVVPAPSSPASRSRLAAEGAFLAAGGLVLRPGLVLGEGDRWVVPALADLLRCVPYCWDGGNALLSLVHVGDLGRLIAAAATTAHAVTGVLHAGHPHPVRLGDLLAELAAHGVLPPVHEDASWEECLALLEATDGWVSAGQFTLLARDHHYRSDEVWRALDLAPGPGPLERLAGSAAWYRRHLAATAD